MEELTRATLDIAVNNDPMEVDDVQEEIIEGLRVKLTAADAVFENSAVERVQEVMEYGVEGQEVVEMLEEGFVGIPLMCGLLCEWLELSGGAGEIVEGYFESFSLGKFDPALIDSQVGDLELGEVDWVVQLTENAKWRQMFYTLSKKFPESKFLNKVLQFLSVLGYDNEILSLASVSIYFSGFNRVIKEGLIPVLRSDDNTLQQHLATLKELCGHSEYTYLYMITLFKVLAETVNPRINRLFQEVTSLISKERALARKISGYVSNTDISSRGSIKNSELSKHVNEMLNDKATNPADIMSLYNAYTEGEPPISIIRKHDFMRLIIKDIYSPSKKVSVKYRKNYLFVLSYASCFDENKPAEESKTEIHEVAKVLEKLYSICRSTIAGTEVQENLYLFEKTLPISIVSMVTLYWIERNLMDPYFHNSGYNTKAINVLLDLLKEIAFLHVFQRANVLRILNSCFALDTELDAMAAIEVKKFILDSIVFLMECGYAIPPLMCAEQWLDDAVDQSLVRYFISKIVKFFKPPFSMEYLTRASSLVELFLNRARTQEPDFITLISAWAERSLNETPAVPESLKHRLEKIKAFASEEAKTVDRQLARSQSGTGQALASTVRTKQILQRAVHPHKVRKLSSSQSQKEKLELAEKKEKKEKQKEKESAESKHKEEKEKEPKETRHKDLKVKLKKKDSPSKPHRTEKLKISLGSPIKKKKKNHKKRKAKDAYIDDYELDDFVVDDVDEDEAFTPYEVDTDSPRNKYNLRPRKKRRLE